MKKNHKKARIEVEGRTFELEFWEDYSICNITLPYVSASEIIEKTLPVTWFRKQPQIKEECVSINYGWTTEDRVKLGIEWIYNYLQDEKEQAEYQDNLSKFLEKYGVN